MPRLKRWKWTEWVQQRYAQYVRDDPDVVAIDTETTGVAFYDRPFAATLSWRGQDGSLQNAYIDLDEEGYEARVELLWDMLARADTWVFHNAKFDLQKLELIGALPQEQATLEDTQAIYHLLDENEPKGLKHLAVTVLRYSDVIQVPYLSGKKKGQLRPVSKEKYQLDRARRRQGLTKDDGYYWIDRQVIVPYALRDTDFTLQLFEEGRPRITEVGMEEVYREEIDLIRVMLRMERNGFALDLPLLEETTSTYGVRVMELTEQLRELSGRDDFNPNAVAHIQEAFVKTGRRVPNTQEATLEPIAQSGGKGAKLARAILDYRQAKKIHTTYLSGLKAEQRDGIVHPHFNLSTARTGRMSSSTAHE